MTDKSMVTTLMHPEIQGRPNVANTLMQAHTCGLVQKLDENRCIMWSTEERSLQGVERVQTVLPATDG